MQLWNSDGTPGPAVFPGRHMILSGVFPDLKDRPNFIYGLKTLFLFFDFSSVLLFNPILSVIMKKNVSPL